MKIPLDWSSDDNAWMAVLSRWGESGQAGKHGQNTDPKEPIMTFSFSGDREPQWNVYPLNLTYPTTSWGQGLPEETWWHLAVVNDGKHSATPGTATAPVQRPCLPPTEVAGRLRSRRPPTRPGSLLFARLPHLR